MASSDGSQSISDADQLGNMPSRGKVSRIRIGSFNVSVHQNMLESENVREVLRQMENTIITCVKEGCLDIMNLCALGGHMQGLASCTPPIPPRAMKIFDVPPTSPGPYVSVECNYLTAWAFNADASQLGSQRTATDCCRSFALDCEKSDPELIVKKILNVDGVTVYQGNLHIKNPRT